MPHKQRGTGPNGEDTTYVYSREEDRSFWARTSATMDKYKLLWWIVWPIIISAGFGFRTPVQAFGEIHAEIDTLKSQVSVAQRERSTIQMQMDQLIRLECVRINRENLQTEAMLVGIDCQRRAP